jgi:hypothetical protein
MGFNFRKLIYYKDPICTVLRRTNENISTWMRSQKTVYIKTIRGMLSLRLGRSFATNATEKEFSVMRYKHTMQF